MTNMQVRGCRVRDLNPHARNVSTSGYAGHGTESEQAFGLPAALEAPSNLRSVPHGNRDQGPAMRYTLVVDLVGSTETFTVEAESVDEALRYAVALHPGARSATVTQVAYTWESTDAWPAYLPGVPV